MEHCGALIDKFINLNISSDLLDLLLNNNTQQQQLLPTISGLNDNDYQNISNICNLKNIDNTSSINKVSIPPEILEHFNHIKCHCMMGLFPEIGRAWLTIDSEIYIWTYSKVRDVAYYDGLNTVIVSVGLVTPKQGVFISTVKYLLILTTPTEIIILGVTFNTPSVCQNSSIGNTNEELQLLNKPIFCINTENVAMNVVKGTYDGRIFLGGQDGFLYEIQYRAESSWFGKRFKKINHSQGVISTIVPNFLKVFSETDPIVKIEIDNSRNLLYILTEKSSIEVWDIGTDSSCVRRLSKIMQSDIANICSNALKTVDLNVFKPIKCITALTLDDSQYLNLLVVTHSGVRIYMSTSFQQKFNIPSNFEQTLTPPTGLYIIHVRLPPGYTPNTTFVNTPKQIHSVFYDKNCTLFMSSQQHDQDILWSLSTAAFSNKLKLSESSSLMPLDGIVWDVAELSNGQHGNKYKSAIRSEQMMKNIVLLTNQGVHILTLQKPIDILHQLLVMCGGPHNELIREFFRANTPVEACLVCLMLACSKQYSNTNSALWAMQAFILYGADMRKNMQTTNKNRQVNQPIFMSTPLNTDRYILNVQDSQTLTNISNINQTNIPGINNPNYSAKHEAMYKYVSKIILSIWKMPCVTKQMTSSLTSNDCNEILEDLNAIKTLLETSSISDLSYIHKSEILEATLPNSMYCTNTSTLNQNALIEQMQCEEKQSLTYLSQFIKQVCEVISLWKILNEHNFDMIMALLSNNFKSILSTSTFRDLITTSTDVCSNLIIAVMNSYLNDNASVSTISMKLREDCPNLFRREDAVSFKATEILIASKKCMNLEEKEQQFRTALQLCKESAPNLQCSNICQQFTLAGFYEGVIDLVSTCAQKFDPENIAVHYYKREECNDNREEYIAFNGRKEFYKEVKSLLDYVYQMVCNENNNTSCNFPQENVNNVRIMKLIAYAMERNDYLLHISIYEWLLEHDMISELLNISEESLGEFLRRLAMNNKDDIKIIDVLWKYYEKRSQHSSAANILNNLASIKCSSIDLDQRIEYLARAVMCMRNDNTGYSVTNGALLRDYEDKLEIARVQKIILDTLSRLPRTEQTNKSIEYLNSSLFTITDLYTKFAEPLELLECKLHILNCSHHNDPLLIEGIWNAILEKSINNELPCSERATFLLTKVENLVTEFSDSGHCFPISFIVKKLEIISCSNKFSRGSVPAALFKMKVDLEFLLNCYSGMLSSNERVWANEGNEWHLIESSQTIIEFILSNINSFNSRSRKTIIAKVQDMISSCLNLCYPKPGTEVLQQNLRELQVRCQRLL